MDYEVSNIINKSIIDTGEAVHHVDKEMNVPGYLGHFVFYLALKVYEAAPSCEAAEKLIQESVNLAKQTFLQEDV